MVADFKIKDIPPRSLVMVPGSGRNKGAAAPVISCDLGRVSSLAATIPVPCLPAIMTRTKQFVPALTNNLAKNKLATSQVMVSIPASSASPSRRRPMNSEANQESKRPRLGVHTLSTSATSHRMVEGNVSSSQPVVVVPAGTQSSGGQERPKLIATRRVATAMTTQPQLVPSSDYGSKSLEELLQEQRNLREENRKLLEQLAHYTRMNQERQRRLHGIVV